MVGRSLLEVAGSSSSSQGTACKVKKRPCVLAGRKKAFKRTYKGTAPSTHLPQDIYLIRKGKYQIMTTYIYGFVPYRPKMVCEK